MIFGNKHLKAKLDKATKDYIDLQGDIATKKADLAGKEIDLENSKKRQQMDFDKRVHDAKLKAETAEAKLASSKDIWEAEKSALTENMEKRSEVEKFELETTLKLKAEQDVAQAKLDADKAVAKMTTEHVEAISKLKTDHAVELSKVSTKANDDAYQSIKKNLEDVTKHGTAASKDTKELIGALISQMPRAGADINANLNIGNQLPASKVVTETVTPAN